jgi:glycosyltransferase involved in cell wall biosynthesis
MACSTPVIALMGPGQKDIIRQNKNGLLVSTKEEMAQAIKFLAEHNKTFISLQKEAWCTAQNYLPEKFREKLLAAYRQVIDG